MSQSSSVHTASNRRPNATCTRCRVVYRPKTSSRTKFCSRECAFAHKRENPRHRCKVCKKPTPSQSGGYCSPGCMKVDREIRCAWCGKPFLKSKNAKTCSPACRRAKYEADFRQAWIDKRGPRVLDRVCSICGKDYVAPTARDRVRACSDECQAQVKRVARKNGKSARKARMKNAHVASYSRLDIYMRDGWACQLCGELIDQSAQVPDPFAATIDHVVAIAKGGADAPANVRAAHFICNSHRNMHDIGPVRALASRFESAQVREC